MHTETYPLISYIKHILLCAHAYFYDTCTCAVSYSYWTVARTGWYLGRYPPVTHVGASWFPTLTGTLVPETYPIGPSVRLPRRP